jgi:hypothetical protein
MNYSAHKPPSVSPKRNGCLTALMVIVGVIMLLPGVCGLIFGIGSLGQSHMDSTVLQLVLLGLAIGAAGIFLIRAAIREPRP